MKKLVLDTLNQKVTSSTLSVELVTFWFRVSNTIFHFY